MQKYNVYASRSNECAYLATDDSPSIPAEPVYLARDVDAALAAKDAEIAALKADTARLDKLPQCFHMLRTCPGTKPGSPWWYSYQTNIEYPSLREAIDAHQEPKP